VCSSDLAALRGEQDTTRHRLNREFTEGVASRGLARPDAFSSWAQGCAALAAERPLDAVQRMRSMNSWNGQTNTVVRVMAAPHFTERSEEHTSELQSRENLVCRLLLEKKKNCTKKNATDKE